MNDIARVEREQAAGNMMNRQIKNISNSYKNLMMLYQNYPDVPVDWTLLTLTMDKLHAFRVAELDLKDTDDGC